MNDFLFRYRTTTFALQFTIICEERLEIRNKIFCAIILNQFGNMPSNFTNLILFLRHYHIVYYNVSRFS